ncbi:hypothetical protein K456DRAFT_40161 [Colletotrichum gloeosporioides 23]|nr:hypothetical protein K456DRAFT_40161 [Colletotrichum gloeosporioides 23]
MANREVGFGRVGAPLVLAVLVDDQWERATPEQRHRDFPRAPAFLPTHGGHPGAQTWQRVSALASALALGLRCFLLFCLFASFPHFPSRFHRRASFPGPATWIPGLGVDWIHCQPEIASALIGALLLAAERPRRTCGNEKMSSVWRHPWPLLRGYGTMETSKHFSEALLLLPKGQREGNPQRQDNGRLVQGLPSSQKESRQVPNTDDPFAILGHRQICSSSLFRRSRPHLPPKSPSPAVPHPILPLSSPYALPS